MSSSGLQAGDPKRIGRYSVLRRLGMDDSDQSRSMNEINSFFGSQPNQDAEDFTDLDYPQPQLVPQTEEHVNSSLKHRFPFFCCLCIAPAHYANLCFKMPLVKHFYIICILVPEYQFLVILLFNFNPKF